MTATGQFSRAQRHIDVLEGWKLDHPTALECWDLEGWIHDVMKVLDMIDANKMRGRKGAFHSLASDEFIAWHDEQTRRMYVAWLEKVTPSLSEVANMERIFGTVVGGEEFRGRIAETEDAVNSWAKPVRSISPAMRVWEISGQEAEELRTLRKSPAGSPGKLNFTPVGVPEREPAAIK